MNNDKLTLAVAKVPQIYLYGVIDANAPGRFEALMRAGKIPRGSDVYLNAPGGDVNAGIALGKMFRDGNMTTHLGSPRKTSRSAATPKAAVCAGACAYAYLGGLYRWAPTGNDRFGLSPLNNASANTADASPTQAAHEETNYLEQMGIDTRSLASTTNQTSGDTWLSADQMLMTGLANNGRLVPTATYHLMGGSPFLTLGQSARDGEHRITLLCKPDGLTITAYYMIGDDRAKRIVARGAHSYFEIDQQQTLQQDRDGVSALNQSVVISRPVQLTELSRLSSARSMGAWLSDTGGAVRYGFSMELDGVRNSLREYRQSCEQLAKQSKAQKS